MPSISTPSLGLSPPTTTRPLHQSQIRPTSDDTTTHSVSSSSKDAQLTPKREPHSDNITSPTLPSTTTAKVDSMTTSCSPEPIVIPRTRVHKSPSTPTRLPHEFDHIAYMEDMETDNRRYSEAKGLEKFMPEDGITPITEMDEPLRIDVESLRSLSRCRHGLADDLDAMSHHEAEKVNIIMAMLRKVKSATDLVVITTSRPFALSARPNRLGRGARPRSRERPKTPPSPPSMTEHLHSRSTSDDSMFQVPEKTTHMAKSWLFSVRRSDEGTLRKVTV